MFAAGLRPAKETRFAPDHETEVLHCDARWGADAAMFEELAEGQRIPRKRARSIAKEVYASGSDERVEVLGYILETWESARPEISAEILALAIRDQEDEIAELAFSHADPSNLGAALQVALNANAGPWVERLSAAGPASDDALQAALDAERHDLVPAILDRGVRPSWRSMQIAYKKFRPDDPSSVRTFALVSAKGWNATRNDHRAVLWLDSDKLANSVRDMGLDATIEQALEARMTYLAYIACPANDKGLAAAEVMLQNGASPNVPDAGKRTALNCPELPSNDDTFQGSGRDGRTAEEARRQGNPGQEAQGLPRRSTTRIPGRVECGSRHAGTNQGR